MAARAVWWSLAGAWTFVVVFVCTLRGTWVSAWIKELIGLSSRLGLQKGLIDDRVLHGVSFLILALLYATALGEGSWRRVARPALLRTGGALLLLGLVLEVVQRWIPGRTFDLPDLAANSSGVLLGLLVPALLARGPAGAPTATEGVSAPA
jgi:hypothetical protein